MTTLVRPIIAVAVLLASTLCALPTAAQLQGPMPGTGQPMGPTFEAAAITQFNPNNPAALLSAAGQMLPTDGPSSSRAPDQGGLSSALNVMILLSVLTLAPSIMLMTTSFVRILIVLGLLRQALGTQGLPPPQVLTGLALFMTLLVMAPTFERVYDEAIVPYNNGEIRDYDTLWNNAKQPIRDFMFDQIEATGNWSSLYMVLNYRGVDTSDPQSLTRADVDMVTLVPAFMLSELKTAFLMGFRVYLPFLVIDMVIAALLISMSMMMLPPVLISLPFKLLLFVLVDGWQLVTGGLLASFAREGYSPRLSAVSAVAADVSALSTSVVPPG